VEAPSIESTDDLRCGSATTLSSSFPKENCEENCFLLPPPLLDPEASAVPKMSLDPPPGGFKTLLEILVSSDTPTVKFTDIAGRVLFFYLTDSSRFKKEATSVSTNLTRQTEMSF